MTSQLVTLDQKLADYVFFPLSYLFRQSTVLPAQATELSLKCLQILILSGWCRQGGAALCKQVIVLLGFLTGGRAIDAQICDLNEEVSVAALHCFSSLFETSKDYILSSEKSFDTQGMLSLGHTVTVILDSLVDGPSSDVQLAALEAIKSLISCNQDGTILRKFLPGIVSKLTKVLQPRTQSPRSYKVLEGALSTMSLLLSKTMATRQLHQASSSALSVSQNPSGTDIHPEDAWIKATSAQIKLALTNIMQLKHHEKVEVVEALVEMCITVLRDCRETLANITSLVLETLISICGRPDTGNMSEKIHLVQNLVTLDASLIENLRVAIYDLVSTLPRVIQSNDTASHSQHISQISAAYQVIAHTGVNMDTLDNAIGSHLCESVTAAIKVSKSAKVESLRHESQSQSIMIDFGREMASTTTFSHFSLVDKSQRGALGGLRNLLGDIESTRLSLPLRQRLTASLMASSDIEQLGCLWLCSNLIGSSLASASGVDLLSDNQSNFNDEHDQFSELVYSYCLNVLSTPIAEDGCDWRLQAMALQVLASRSCQQRHEYRPELVDALYPVVECLGSSNVILREHAMTSLNTIAMACDYRSSSDLIIQNVDYLVNSVALRLNTFEITPRDPQVIFTMVKLCGPTLLPYLDDLIESIFSTLASYHGYSQLVELLFSVLSVVVEESSKVNLSPDCTTINTHPRKTCLSPTTVSQTADILKQIRPKTGITVEPQVNIRPEAFDTTFDESGVCSNSGNFNDRSSEVATEAPTARSQLPSKTYITVQTIVRTGQHYLTHESPNIRRKLLRLTALSCSALYRNEDEFLPVINDIWPVVIKRLYDSEFFVSIAASEAISDIFKYAGDFVASRVEIEWPGICNLYRRVHGRMLNEKRGKCGRGDFTITFQLWDALVKMLCRLVEWVRIGAEVEDDLMDMLGPYVHSRSDVREALNTVNPDVVWFNLEAERQRSTTGDELSPPLVEGVVFKSMLI